MSCMIFRALTCAVTAARWPTLLFLALITILREAWLTPIRRHALLYTRMPHITGQADACETACNETITMNLQRFE